jgi:Ser/Thr protein kinase RdoA (MazF antagonist)
MTASKQRPRWDDLPAQVRAEIEQLVAGPVVAAQNCEGGFSPGFASRLRLANGRLAFAKAVDTDAWPQEAAFHRAEALVAAALPAMVPAPRFLGSRDHGHWVILAFEGIDGTEPSQPWNQADLHRVAAAITQLSQAVTPSPITLPGDHPRLGGWAALTRDPPRRARLRAHSRWAASHLPLLTELEHQGLAAARGTTLVHFDLYPHNILMTPSRVLFVDWPHARLAAPFLDLLLLLSSAAAGGIDPEPIIRDNPLTTGTDPRAIDAVLAAHAGFCFAGALAPAPPGLEPITAAKLALGRATIAWLKRRLTSPN